MKRILLLSKWQTPDGTILTSKYTHDYNQHLDANGESYVIDGGRGCIRRSQNHEPMKDLCILSDSKWEDIRTNITRGVLVTVKEKQVYYYIPICNLTTDHLENLIKFYQNDLSKIYNEDDINWMNVDLILYLKEILYRWNKGIFVPDYKYTKNSEALDPIYDNSAYLQIYPADSKVPENSDITLHDYIVLMIDQFKHHQCCDEILILYVKKVLSLLGYDNFDIN